MAFSGRNQKFKRFYRPKTGDLQKKKEKKKGFRRNQKAFSGRNKFKWFYDLQKKKRRMVFAEIRWLFLVEIRNLNVFFQHSILDGGGRLNLDGGRLNLDGGRLNLDGGTRPPYNLGTDQSRIR